MRLCLCQRVGQELFAWDMFFGCFTSRFRFDVGACSKKSDLAPRRKDVSRFHWAAYFASALEPGSVRTCDVACVSP